MANLVMQSAIIGLSNVYQDHYMRAHSLNINPDDMNQMLANRLGGTNRVAPVEMRDIAARSGGVATVSGGQAYIEDGWHTSRGLASFQFVVQGASPIQSQTLTVYGYMHGGSPAMAGGQLPPDIFFVPVKMWLVETQVSMNSQGFPVEQRNMRQSGNFLLNDESSKQGTHTIRPMDVINSVSALAAFDGADQMGGMMDGFGGSTSGLLSTIGMNISKSENNSTVDYAEKILTAAATASFEREYSNDRFSAICAATGNSNIKEISLEDSPFIKVMRSSLGYVTMAHFQGFTLGEIAQVFPNFAQVANTQLTNDSTYQVEDHRYTSNQMGGSTYETLACSELNNIGNMIMNHYRLSYVHIRATNNMPDGQGQLLINGAPVGYQLGESGPIIDKDPDWQYNVIQGVEAFLTQFYSKYNHSLLQQRTLVDIDCNLALFGESTISVALHGNTSNTHTETFGTMAGNRFDPTLVTTEGLGQSVTGFYRNLTDYMNF